MRSKRGLTLLALPLLAVLFLSINVLVGLLLPHVRVDLTENKLFSLSDGTLTVLEAIDEPVTFRLFYSEELGRAAPAYAAYQKRVVNLLEEYAQRSGGGLKLEIFNPAPFSELEDEAVRFGLQGVPLDESGANVYFGLAGSNATDDVEIVPFFQPERERFLEYDLTRMVQALANPERPLVGVLSTLPIQGMFRGAQGSLPPWQVLEQIRANFDTRMLRQDLTEIDDDIDLLMLVQPRELSPAALYAIDQFVMGGGSMLAFVDPYSEVAAVEGRQQGGLPGANAAADLGPLLESWGITLKQDVFVGDLTLGMQVNAGGPRPVQYIAWIQPRASEMAADDVVTGDLEIVSLGTAGILEPIEGGGVTVTPLIRSTPDSMAVEIEEIRFGPRPDQLLEDFEATPETYTLAARLTGRFATAFPDGPPEGVGTATHRVQSDGTGSIIVIADSDLLEDRFWVNRAAFFDRAVNTPFADNGNLVLNALENLSGGEGLIGLRGRGVSQRPFTVFDDLEAEAARQFQAQEEALTDELSKINRKLEELQGGPTGGEAILTPEQEAEILAFERELLAIRASLRDVQRSLRESVEAERTKLLFFNIGLVPALVIVAALVVAFVRTGRRRAGARG
ncbi:MAG: Gldg family protein [Alphaproteobacteria bacterium]|nr:Gldg family protein [Alphaproteobacteria bacterium]